MNVFRAVKENVTARQVAEHYGLKVSSTGMACCPFHDDHNPSLKLDERYYCFGCQATGDAIDLAAAFLHLTPLEAAKQLAADFSIPYDTQDRGKPQMTSKERLQAMKKLQERRAFLDWKKKTLFKLADYFRILEDCKEKYAPKTRDEPWSPLFIQSCNDQTLVNLYTFLLEQAPEEDQRALFGERSSTIEALAQRVAALTAEQTRRPRSFISQTL